MSLVPGFLTKCLQLKSLASGQAGAGNCIDCSVLCAWLLSSCRAWQPTGGGGDGGAVRAIRGQCKTPGGGGRRGRGGGGGLRWKGGWGGGRPPLPAGRGWSSGFHGVPLLCVTQLSSALNGLRPSLSCYI